MASYFSCSIGEEQQFRVALQNGGMTAELVRTVGNDAALGRCMVEALKARLQTGSEPDHSPITHVISLDSTISLENAIAAGKYDWVNPIITSERFPDLGQGEVLLVVEVEVILIHLGKHKTGDRISAELDRRGLTPGDIRHLLALGAMHPKLQLQFPIMALGSSWRDPHGTRSFPVLWKDDRGRTLGLRSEKPDLRRSVEDRVLAVRA